MKLTIKTDNNLIGEAKQIELLPRFSIFWNTDYLYGNSICIGFGWLMFNIDFWFE